MRRNPYLILGLDHGTTERDLINRGLSRASRRVRSQASASASASFDVTDCTWAVDELTRGDLDPATDITTFRVPADPAVFERTADVPVPPPRNLARTTGPSDEALDLLRAEILADICGAGLDDAVSSWFGSASLSDRPRPR